MKIAAHAVPCSVCRLTQKASHAFTHSPTYSFTHPPTHPTFHPFTQPEPPHPPTTHPPTQSKTIRPSCLSACCSSTATFHSPGRTPLTCKMQRAKCRHGVHLCWCRWALLLQAETVTGLFQDTLAKLDNVFFTLPIEVPSKTPTAAAAAALLSSAGSLFKRQQSHYQASTSSPSSMPGQESTTSAENGSVSRKQLHASTKR